MASIFDDLPEDDSGNGSAADLLSLFEGVDLDDPTEVVRRIRLLVLQGKISVSHGRRLIEMYRESERTRQLVASADSAHISRETIDGKRQAVDDAVDLRLFDEQFGEPEDRDDNSEIAAELSKIAHGLPAEPKPQPERRGPPTPPTKIAGEQEKERDPICEANEEAARGGTIASKMFEQLGSG